MRCEILIGGKAGQGPNFLSEILAQALIKHGYYVFYSRDYQSLIRGGHNFNQVSFSDKPIYSNTSKINILVCLDESTEKIHSKSVQKNGIVLKFIQGKENMFYAGALFKILGINFEEIKSLLKDLKNFEENMKNSQEGYNSEKRELGIKKLNKKIEMNLLNGSESTALSSIKSGLNLYYAYPMTPATPLMMELGEAQLDAKNHHRVIEVENEIAVALAGMGSSVVGKRVMVGTSGGGFDLMTEALSFTAQAEIPLVFYLSQRPGPGTGVATYTSQGDLNLALHAGHGEFFRMVLAPGDNEESVKLTNDAFYFSYKYRIPSIVLTDKHLAESKSLFDEKSALKKIKEIKSNIKIGERFNSYESDLKNNKVATEDAEVIRANFEKRLRRWQEIEAECVDFERVKICGNKNSKNIILSWGSTKGAILDAINENKLDVKFVQILYMSPFPTKQIKNIIEKSKRVLVVENNFDSPLSKLVTEKTGFIIDDKNKILRYDGRPFFSDELNEKIREMLR